MKFKRSPNTQCTHFRLKFKAIPDIGKVLCPDCGKLVKKNER